MNPDYVSSDTYLDDLNSHLRSRRGVRPSPEHFSPVSSTGTSSASASYRLSPSIHHPPNVHYQHHLHYSQRHNPGGGDAESSSDAASSTLINLVNLITENVIVHPFLVVRRQCQVMFVRLIIIITKKSNVQNSLPGDKNLW